MPRSLVDTNILVYSRDLNEPVKRARAIELIDRLGASGEQDEEVEGVRFINPFKPS